MYRTATSKTVSQGYEVVYVISAKKTEMAEMVNAKSFSAFYHLCFILSKAI